MPIKLSFIYKKPHSKIISFTKIIKSCKPALSLFYRGFRVPSPCILVVRDRTLADESDSLNQPISRTLADEPDSLNQPISRTLADEYYFYLNDVRFIS